ncbi:6-carboxyhexanoate--CoA ligase [Bacillus tianshenii]|nr:6-carboxyhexanoate--CoA ligase [Bacillus tianshenii]
MPEKIYSLRMRSAEGGSHEVGGTHISGAERILKQSQLEAYAKQMISRALQHERGEADFIQLVAETIPQEDIQYIEPLEPMTMQYNNLSETRFAVRTYLIDLGVSVNAIEKAFQLLSRQAGFAGAYLVHSRTGEILNPNGQAVRVSRIDWDEDSYKQWAKSNHQLATTRIREAVALASKVSSSPYTLAELCWSDDPSYVTGYIANKDLGYFRITPFKEQGDYSGGRVFFVADDANIEDYIHYLSKVPILIGGEKSDISAE